MAYPTKSRTGVYSDPAGILAVTPISQGGNHSIPDRCGWCNHPASTLYPYDLPDPTRRFTFAGQPQDRVCISCLGKLNGAKRKGKTLEKPGKQHTYHEPKKGRKPRRARYGRVKYP